MTPWYRTSWLIVMISVAVSSCGSEPYAACNLPRSAALDESCRGQGGVQQGQQTSVASTCVVDAVFECESQLCATYEGAEAFCTEPCADRDGDGAIDDDEHAVCPQNGLCVEFIPGTGEYFCISDALAREKNMR